MIAPVVASAQPETKAPQISIDPAAKALLDKATATYKAANGLSFESVLNEGHSLPRVTQVKVSRPNLLRVDFFPKGQSSQSTRLVSDGQNVYLINFYLASAASYQKMEHEAAIVKWLHNVTDATEVIAPMLEGKNPLDSLVWKYQPSATGSEVRVESLGARLIDGDVLRGVRVKYAVKETSQSNENTMWFGSDSTLRRYQVLLKRNSSRGIQTFTAQEKISNQQLNPQFPLDTFKADLTGLKQRPADVR